MSIGQKKTSAVKPTTSTSQFKGLDNFVVNLDGLATGSAQRGNDGRTLVTQSQLAGPLQGLQSLSLQGLNHQLGAIHQSPEQQYTQLLQGLNPYYNLAQASNQREATNALTEAQGRFSRNGLENSTVRGAYEAQLANDALLRDLTARNEAMNQANEQARLNAKSFESVFSDLAAIQQAPAQLANDNLLSAFGQVDKVNEANAQRAQQAALYNAGVQNDMAQQAAALQNRIASQLASAAIPLASRSAGLAINGLAGLLGRPYNTVGYTRPLPPQVSGFGRNFLGKL
jgi:hypothetical protein